MADVNYNIGPPTSPDMTQSGVLYPNTIAQQQQNIFSQGIQNQLAKLKLQHDIQQTNWLKTVFPNQGAYSPQELMQSAAQTGSMDLMQQLPNIQNQPLNQQILQSKAREYNAIASFKERLANSPYLIGPGMGGISGAERMEWIKNHPNPPGQPSPTLEDADNAIRASNMTSSTQSRLKAEGDSIEQMVGPEGMDTMAAKSLFLNEKQGGMLGGILNAKLASKYGDLLKNVKLPDGRPATPQDIGLIRGNITSLTDSLKFQQKWASSVNNRASLIEGALPTLERLYDNLPVDAKSMPFRDLQVWAGKNIKGSAEIGAYITMQAELARDYNMALIASGTGAGGAGGTGPEREEVYGQLRPDLPPETFHGQALGVHTMLGIRKNGIQQTISGLMDKLDKSTGGKGQALISESPDLNPVEQMINQSRQQQNPNQMVPGGNYSLFNLMMNPSQ